VIGNPITHSLEIIMKTTLEQQIDNEIMRKVQSFTNWISEGYSYNFAW